MKLFSIKKNPQSILWTMTSVCFVFGFLNVFVSYAGVTHNVEGFAWNDLTGWISFNSTNCDPDGNGLSDSGIEGCPTGSADHWDEVNDEIADGDASYIYTDSATEQKDIYTLTNHTTETGAISLVSVHTIGKGDGCAKVYLRLGTDEYGGGSTACGGDATWNIHPSEFTNNKPGTFDLWDWTAIDALQAGVGINKTGAASMKITQVYVEVTYDGGSILTLYPDGDGDYTNIEEPADVVPVAVPDYGVNIDGAGDFSKYAWNSNAGWISFEAGDVAGCPSGACQANLAGTDVSGWAKIISLGNEGWLSLNCSNTGTCGAVDYKVIYNIVTGEFEGWGWNNTLGWISFNALNCDADEDGFSDGAASCPALGTVVADYAVTYPDGITGNVAPDVPNVTGPNTGFIDTDYEFRFVSGDEYLKNTKQIEAGGWHSCSLTNQGGVYCWGYGNYGGIGNDSADHQYIPVRVHDGEATGADTDGTYLTNIKQIDVGTFQTCAITNDGKAYCWGGNLSGELGIGVTGNRNTPVRVHDGEATGVNTDGTYLTNIKKIDAGAFVTCALTNDGKVYCWGGNGNASLGNDSTTLSYYTPVRVHDGEATGADTDGTYLTNIKQISLKEYHTCALTNEGRVYCWGFNNGGQLGNDSTTLKYYIPVRVHDGEATGVNTDGTYLINAKQIDAGGYHSCVLTNDEGMYCWGSNYSGQLGNDSTTLNYYTPVRVHDGEATGVDTDGTYLINAKQIDAGNFHTCALTNDEGMYCWGYGEYGQLGNDSMTEEQYTPVRVHDGEATGADTDGTYLTNIQQIGIGIYRTCALTNDRRVYCWGYGGYGGLGNDSADHQYTSVKVYAGEALENLRYGIDWAPITGSVDEWVPSDLVTDTYVLSGTELSTTTSWSTSGDKTFKVLAEDDGHLRSDWKTHNFNIPANNQPLAIINLPENTKTYQSPVALSGVFSDDLADLFHGFEWYKNDSTCSVPANMIHGVYPTGYVEGEDMTTSISVPITPDGNYKICFRVADNHVGDANQWSECECVDITIGTQCNDGKDNDDNDGFCDGLGSTCTDGSTPGDPACYDADGVYHPEYNDESDDPQCSDGQDNDDDELIDIADHGCYNNFDVSTGVYNPFGIIEETCGENNPTTGELSCDPGETFGNCPIDCADAFKFIEF